MVQTTEQLAAEANRLYWETDLSVAGIAQQLQLSRRALYDAVQPLPSGATCQTCGSPLVYENRSARTAHEETCIVCEAEIEEVEEVEDEAEKAEEPQVETAPAPAAALVEMMNGEGTQRAVRVGGAALAGAALGALVTLALVPRR